MPSNSLLSKQKKASVVRTDPFAPLGEHLEAGQRPKNDYEWREAIAFIQEHLRGIMAVCNKQAGQSASDFLSYEENVLFWYAHLADEIIKRKKAVAEPELVAIDI